MICVECGCDSASPPDRPFVEARATPRDAKHYAPSVFVCLWDLEDWVGNQLKVHEPAPAVNLVIELRLPQEAKQ